ncbi:MAG: HAD-IA family hydrolase, partial [Chloroflexota bacterium]|nr:HAD-IA family hydrolase [Chloroflexota bacterium]
PVALARPIDAVVFDVDGVLVDVDASYVEAVVRTVQWLLVQDASMVDDGPATDRATVKLFKRVGSWNNDWDLSYGIYRWLLAGPAPHRTTAGIRAAGGDPNAAARRSLRELSAVGGHIPARTYDEVRGVFEEFYTGTQEAVDQRGIVPRVHREEGLRAREPVLLRGETIEALRARGITKFGVVTGRTVPEWDHVRERLPLPADVPVATDDDGRKPDPSPLRRVVASLACTRAMFVGDTLDDLRMVQAYADGSEPAPEAVAVMVCPGDDEPAYRAAGARFFVRSVNDLPVLLDAAHG